jgi:hypothetical protein
MTKLCFSVQSGFLNMKLALNHLYLLPLLLNGGNEGYRNL